MKNQTQMKKLLEANTGSGRRRVSEVFSDFCELSAIAIRNAVDLNGRAEREARYMSIIAGYTADEAERFAELLAHLTLELEDELSDVLGRLYMSLDLGNERLGQFFTPYEVSLLIAKMNIGDYATKLEDKSFITVNEPACGSGGMIIALADSLRSDGINYQQKMHVTATDLATTAVHMTYLQLSLLHVPAVVVHGNTLTLEQYDAWYTPAHIVGGWNAKLRDRALSAGATTAGEPAQDDTADVPYIGPQTFDFEGIQGIA